MRFSWYKLYLIGLLLVCGVTIHFLQKGIHSDTTEIEFQEDGEYKSNGTLNFHNYGYITSATGSSTTQATLTAHEESENDNSLEDETVDLTDDVALDDILNMVEVDLNAQDTVTKAKPKRFNVLFMIVDDMRAQLSPYADPRTVLGRAPLHTPNLEKLAEKSLLLKNMFVQVSLCGPSRASLLTSRRPIATGVFDNVLYWRNVGGDFTTLPQYFKDNGYLSYGIGKIFHPTKDASNESDPISWTKPIHFGKHTERFYMSGTGSGWAVVPQGKEKDFPPLDTANVHTAADLLSQIAPKAISGEEPFFLALGFLKPHLSFVCPEKYYDLYPVEPEKFLAEENWQTPLVRDGCLLQNTTRLPTSQQGYSKYIPSETLRLLRRGYFACTSYTDALVGEVLQTLDELGLSDNTIVSFMADHGYHLGENGVFGKQTLYDTSTRVPMMIHIPGRTDRGITSESMVEAIDVFPTLVEAAGLDPIMPCPNGLTSAIRTCTHGVSLLPLINQHDLTLKDAAMSQVKLPGDHMRVSVRTTDYLYYNTYKVTYKDGLSVKYEPSDADSKWTEKALFDLNLDPDEYSNRINLPEYKKIMNSMEDLLMASVNKLI